MLYTQQPGKEGHSFQKDELYLGIAVIRFDLSTYLTRTWPASMTEQKDIYKLLI